MSELPEGWISEATLSCFEQISTTHKKVKTKECNESGLYPVIDQGLGKVAGYIDNPEKVIKVDSPLIVFGDHTRAVKWIENDFVPGADGTKVLVPKEFVNPRYSYYQLMALEIPDKGYSRHFKFLKTIPFSIPPLNEQTRIANKLDSLLAKVDAAQTRLEKIPTLLKRFRQSVLAAATSGELTREWRGVADFGNVIQIGNLSSSIKYGTSKKCSYDSGNVPVLRIPNMKEGKIVLNDMKFADFDEKELKSLSLQESDILIIRSNGSVGLVGRANVVTKEAQHCLYAGYLIRIRVDLGLADPNYIAYCLRSPRLRGIIEINARSTSGINNINSKELAALDVLLPSLEEQKQIIRRVESLFTLADTVEKQHQATKQRLDRLSQSILAKAFRGELVPQDPNDEPASELLKRIQAERTQQSQNKPKRKTAARKKSAKPKKKSLVMKLSDAPENYLYELLKKQGGEAHAEVLWKQSELSIDDFYAKLKKEMGPNTIVEDNNSRDPSQRKLKVANS